MKSYVKREAWFHAAMVYSCVCGSGKMESGAKLHDMMKDLPKLNGSGPLEHIMLQEKGLQGNSKYLLKSVKGLDKVVDRLRPLELGVTTFLDDDYPSKLCPWFPVL